MADVIADQDAAPPAKAEEHATTTGLPSTKLAMWIFLASECLLFGALITTYLLYRGASRVGPFPNDVFDIPYTSVSSFVLLASSLTMVLAVAAAQKADLIRMRIWLLVTALLGYGILYSWYLVGAAAFIILVGFIGWALEPSVAE